jgi:D-alanyl-D-alanine carboxypeptidase/D-alanyl-D-alanine-endopeptidase (penicillin-binding protein 4)
LPGLALAVLCLGTLPLRAGDLAGRIESIITGPDYKHSRWGILIVDTVSQQAVYAHNADMLFAPASVTKLYTCAAALVALGADHHVETPVFRRGDLTDGRLHGDLILVAQGDLTLGGRTGPDGKVAFRDADHTYSAWLNGKTELTDTDPLAGLRALAKQVKDSGIRHVDGDVLIDDRLFAHARGTGSGPDFLTPIVVNDNLLDIVITPGPAAGMSAAVELRPQTDYWKVEPQVETVGKQERSGIRVEVVGPHRLKVVGKIAVDARPQVRIHAAEDPAAFARALFIETLRREGVAVLADPLHPVKATLPTAKEYADLPRVALLRSPPLSEVLKVILKVSHNLYASTLPLLVAGKHGKRTLPEGMRLERQVLADLGVDVSVISLESGAGGGNGDRVTPRVTVQLLQAMMKRPDFAVYKAGLPVLGVDGTLADAVAKESPARGKILAKTGTYGDSDLLNDRLLLRAKSLAGIMTTKSGRSLVFAIFVNDVPLPRGVEPSREGKVIGKLCEIIYENCP